MDFSADALSDDGDLKNFAAAYEASTCLWLGPRPGALDARDTLLG